MRIPDVRGAAAGRTNAPPDPGGPPNSTSEGTRTATPISSKALLGYTAAKIVPGLLTFAAIPILIHVVGVVQYGLFSVAWATTLFASAIGVGWLRHSGLRAAGDASRALGLLPRWSVVTAGVMPAVLAVGWLVIVGSAMPLARAPSILIAAAMFCTSDALYSMLATRTQRDLRSGRFAMAELVRTAVGLLASLVLCQLLPLPGAAAVLIGNAVGTLFAAFILSGPRRPRLVGQPHPTSYAVLKSYWTYGWPMSLWMAASAGLVYIDRLMLGMLDAGTAGQYAAIADMIVRGTAMLAMPIGMAVHPIVMIQWNSGQPRRAAATLRTYTRMLSAALVCCIVGLVLLGPWIIPRFVPGNLSTRGLIAILATGAALWQCALLAQKPLEVSGRSRLMLTLIIIAAAITVASDAALIPLMGPTGAALAFASGAAFYTGACLLSGRRVMSDRNFAVAQGSDRPPVKGD